jgi:hypothetical protein
MRAAPIAMGPRLRHDLIADEGRGKATPGRPYR